MLHDEAANTSLVILFFANEDDYARGDAALNAMTPGDTPSRRTSVTKTRRIRPVAIEPALTSGGGMLAPSVCRAPDSVGGEPWKRMGRAQERRDFAIRSHTHPQFGIHPRRCFGGG